MDGLSTDPNFSILKKILHCAFCDLSVERCKFDCQLKSVLASALFWPKMIAMALATLLNAAILSLVLKIILFRDVWGRRSRIVLILKVY